jgi:Type IV conjugative transfer system lipoprotein (TraV)
VARTRLIALLLGAGLAGACAGHVPVVPSVPMETALERATAAGRTPLGESLRAGLQGPGTFGTAQPAAPVVIPPDVRRVWVPTHENAEGELVAGHWVFLRVRDFRWFLDASAARDASRPVGLPQDRPESRHRPAANGGPASGVPWVEVAPGGPGAASGSGIPGAASPPPPPLTPSRSPSTTGR